MPIIASRVVWGLGETIATFSPTSTFTSVDLPAFAFPINATYPLFVYSLARLILFNTRSSTARICALSASSIWS